MFGRKITRSLAGLTAVVVLYLAERAWAGPAPAPAASPIVIKFATLAPEGSAWMQRLRELDAAVREKSGGTLGFKFYPGGVSGDEKDVVRKMRAGQIHAGGFTGMGLGEMASEERVLEVPFLVSDDQAAGRVAEGLTPEISEAMHKKGFELLAWAHPGFAYFMTRESATDLASLRKLKIWAWEGDPVAAALFDSLSVTPIPLSLPDVLTSLQTGLIHGAYATPLAAIALQWHARMRYLIQMPVAFVSGAIVMSTAAFERLSETQRQVLRDECRLAAAKLTEQTRRENAAALAAMRTAGMEIVNPPEESRRAFREAGTGARGRLSGKLFSAALLEKAERLAGGK